MIGALREALRGAQQYSAAAIAATALIIAITPGPAMADAAAGREKAKACVACHGVDGNSTQPAIPSLSGQPQQFIVTQLFMFREGKRKDAQMSPFAVNLTNADLNDLADYFSMQKPTRVANPASAEKSAIGKRLAEQNNCTQCHGPALLGLQHIPRVAGQHAQYLRTQLLGFKASTRFDMDGQMTSAAQALSPADIDILAEYLAGLGTP